MKGDVSAAPAAITTEHLLPMHVQSGEMAPRGTAADMFGAEHRFRRIIGDLRRSTPALATVRDLAFCVMTEEVATLITAREDRRTCHPDFHDQRDILRGVSSMTEPVKTRILVADDDRDILELVVFKLTQAGYEVVAVTDGGAALAAIEADPPRLAILDVMMPGLSGIDVLRKVRANEATKDLDVILLTARSRDSDVDAGFATGASDYVIKPFSPRELLHRVTALLARGKR